VKPERRATDRRQVPRRGATRNLKERLVQAGIVLVVPVLFGVLVARPTLKRIDGHKQRFNAASTEAASIPQFSVVTPAEREVLDDPAAAWRNRMPVLVDEQARLAHYHRVVSAAQRGWKAAGVSVVGLRSTWDPIRASFTLPPSVDAAEAPKPVLQDSPDQRIRGWVVEARFSAPTEVLFRALAAVPHFEPLLEPVGLRWESSPDHRQQSLLLRNLVITR
jgi:hypothetical protein